MLISLKTLLSNFQKLISKKLTRFLLLCLVGILLTIIFTWPMVFKLTSLYSDEADYTLIGWIMWYNQLSFTTGRIFSATDYFNSFQFYPWPYSLAFSENLFLPSLIFAPFYWITKNLVFSVNLYTFLTFILTFLSSFYAFNKFLKNNFGAIIAAVIFTFNPITSAHFPGHTHLLGKFFLPWILVSCLNFFSKPTVKQAFFLGLFFTLNALTSINLFIVSIPSVIFLGLPYTAINLYGLNWNYFKKLFSSAMICLIFSPLLIHFILPYQNFSSLEGTKRSTQESIYYSAQLLDWMLPFPESFVYGKIVRTFDYTRIGYPKINYSEHTLGLNIVPLTLFLLGCVAIYKTRLKQNKVFYGAIFTSLIGTLVFTFGPIYQMTWLPYYYFNELTGLLDGTRVPTRFQFFFYLPFSLIAGLGFIFLRKYVKTGFILFIICLELIALENFNLWQIMDSTSSITTNPPVFRQYKSFNFLGDAVTLHIPTYVGPFEKGIYYLNLATLHRERLMNGYSGFFPPEWSDLLAGFEKNLDQETFNKLKALKVNYVILHKDRLPENYITDLKTKRPFLNSWITFENENYLILDVTKNTTTVNRCLLSDIKLEIMPYNSSFGINPTYFNRIKISNPKDCYFINTLNERYLKTVLNVKGNELPVNLKLPPVLGPKEEIILK